MSVPSRRIALAVAFLFATTSMVTLAVPSTAAAWGSGEFSSGSEADLVALTNRSRANAGLKSLKVDSRLRDVARWRSKDMIQRDYFSHDIPGYGKVFDKLHAIGYCYHVAGENIGWNTNPDAEATAVIHGMFMDSAGHRANILGKDYDVIGVGAYKGPSGKKMWTVLFADKCGSTGGGGSGGGDPKPKPDPKPNPKPDPKPKPKPDPKPPTRSQPKPTPKPTPKPVRTSAPSPSPSVTPSPTPIPTPDLVPLPSALPSIEPTNLPEDPVGAPAIALRVVDQAPTGGLLESIVGGVTGFFFGG